MLVTVTKQPGTNTLELTDKLDASIQELRKTLPEDVEVSTDIFRQSRFINSSIHNIQEALLEGAVFVIVVLFFFLMNFRTTIISLVALPLSMLMAILVMHALGLKNLQLEYNKLRQQNITAELMDIVGGSIE